MARGGRRDRPIDRDAGPVAEFVDDLRRLRGALSLQEIGDRMGYHSSTVSRRLSPGERPPLDFVRAYVTACGGDVESWEERWHALEPEGGGPPVGPRRARPWWILAVAAAIATAAVAAWLWIVPEPTPRAAPATSPSPPAPSHGFTWQIERMLSRLSSRTWSQPAAGRVEIWANLSCPRPGGAYWIALRPGGDPVRFACGSWQYHQWPNVPAGIHHFEVWKDNDGLPLSGEGVLRSTIPIVEQPKAG
ncbi:helix-turn-helix domain-containing protein [Thermoactinospora rubra]|uniref:helix-turn-helix domain-containing protein n=1 Tax=Thermoactinospora rubra TaxID=1088767 RepID=UPI000A10DBE3|nr:helix-turn-helix transcriptional regulator [Thermoactinospora rubra]